MPNATAIVIATRIELAYDTLLTAGALNPMPDQPGNFLPLELCTSLHSCIDQLSALRDEVNEILDHEEGG